MTTYRTVSIDGLDIFYREADSRDRRFLTTHVVENTMLEGVMYFVCEFNCANRLSIRTAKATKCKPTNVSASR